MNNTPSFSFLDRMITGQNGACQGSPDNDIFGKLVSPSTDVSMSI